MSVLRVKEPFATDHKGVPRVYRVGDLVDSGDSIVKGREHLFVAVEEVAARSAANFETASAAPAEKRTRSRARKSTSED